MSRMVAAVALLLACPALGAGHEPVVDSPLRFGTSARTIVDMNHNDVTAALKVWMETVAKERGIPLDPTPHIFDRTEDFVAALVRGEIDLASAPTDEFLVLEKAVPLAGLYSTRVGGQIAEEYVLLAPTDRPWRRLEDLRQTRLVVLSHPAAGLAPLWLETELRRAGMPPSEQFFASITYSTKVSRVLLPVFFGQQDVCLVTRRGFEMAGELNPQVSEKLRVLAASPALIPGVGAYRTSISEEAAKKFHEALLNLGDTPAGRQLLTIFQSDAFVELSETDLAPTRAFLAEHAQLREAAARQKAVFTTDPVSEDKKP